jgi:hypothetical protein
MELRVSSPCMNAGAFTLCFFGKVKLASSCRHILEIPK